MCYLALPNTIIGAAYSFLGSHTHKDTNKIHHTPYISYISNYIIIYNYMIYAFVVVE